ncbi:hypothetical protein WDH52_15920 [Streptomyces sp. TRM70308]|uniref:hypothetical protein n=1 Tax=Streptomyces TaxID=1883 RepID=UPI002248CC41|nr:hypothetical protein [Streptomyces sp. JHD 1]MCX2968894.1 hypothetical protein [Streptomyces sp. JHD 1]
MVIAEGRLADAQSAAEELRRACREAGVGLPGVRVDERVWDSPAHGPVRLVELGGALPDAARELAAALRQAAAS